MSAGVAVEQANEEEAYHQKVVCAGQHPERWPSTAAATGLLTDEQAGFPLYLKQVGCSDKEDETVSYAEARNPPEFNWWVSLLPPLGLGLGVTLAVSLALYGIVRAIGWVIGGFAA